MLEPGQRVVVGVSGGPDSTALALALKAISHSGGFGWELHIAHVHHGLRGEEADADASYVEELANKLGAMFHVEQFDVAANAKKEKISVETAGRLCRYDFFEKVAREVDSQAVAVGHTADDNAETVLQRVLRGAGLKGLAGIPRKRVISRGSEIMVVRPLIECTRGEVEGYLAAQGVSARMDASNLETGYTRNKIRNELLPLLEAGYSASVRESLLRIAHVAEAANELLEAEAERYVGGRKSASIAELLRLPVAVQMAAVRRMLENAGVAAELVHVQEALALAASPNPSGRVSLPGNFEAKRSYDELSVREVKDAEARPKPVELSVPGEVCFGEFVMRTEEVDGASFSMEEFKATKGPLEEAVDASKLGESLVVRTREAGDVFRPLGCAGNRKLKKVLIDRKIPREEREQIPLVVSGDRIIWVVGVGIDEWVKVTHATEQVVLFSAERRGDQKG